MSDVQVCREGAVQIIQFNRPQKKNALTHAMYTAANEALIEANEDPTLRVVLLCGHETCFTSGNDMQDFIDGPSGEGKSPVGIFLKLLLNYEKPLVAAVNGNAVAVGCTMLLHCDLVYVGDNTRMILPFASLGLCPEAGSSYLLTRLVGYPKAAELLMLGESFSGQQACDYGIANEVVSGDAYDYALEKAKKLASQPAASIRLTKQFMRGAIREVTRKVMAEEGQNFDKQLVSPEAKEAMTAFVEKRKPDFSQFD